MMLGIFSGLREAFDDRHRRRQIGIADPEVDNIYPSCNRLLLHLIDRRE